jgi:glutathionylspermidine synthase
LAGRRGSLRLRFHHTQGETYWDESACFVFTLEEIERDIEEPSRLLHELCLDLAEAASRDEHLMERLGVPPPFRDYVANSWREREPTMLGRFDLAYAGRGPAKLLEYNADTPTALYEAAFFQWTWLEQTKNSERCRQTRTSSTSSTRS